MATARRGGRGEGKQPTSDKNSLSRCVDARLCRAVLPQREEPQGSLVSIQDNLLRNIMYVQKQVKVCWYFSKLWLALLGNFIAKHRCAYMLGRFLASRKADISLISLLFPTVYLSWEHPSVGGEGDSSSGHYLLVVIGGLSDRRRGGPSTKTFSLSKSYPRGVGELLICLLKLGRFMYLAPRAGAGIVP